MWAGLKSWDLLRDRRGFTERLMSWAFDTRELHSRNGSIPGVDRASTETGSKARGLEGEGQGYFDSFV